MQKIAPTLIKYYWILLMLPAVTGIALDLFITRQGAGISGDGVWYVEGAQNILKGYGYGILRGDGFIPINEFPPLYSILLSGLGIFGGSIFEIARYSNAFFLGGNIFLAGWLIFRLTRSPGITLLGCVFLLLSQDILSTHAWILTEPLFIFLTLLCLANVLLYLEAGHFRNLIFAGLAAGLVVITRYMGIALVAAICSCILFFGRGSRKQRLLSVLLVGTISILPTLLWLVRNAMLDLSLTGRSGVEWRLPRRETMAAMINVIWNWILPSTFFLGNRIRLILLMGLCIPLVGIPIYYLVFRPDCLNHPHPKLTHFLFSLLLFSLFYFATLMLSIVLSLVGGPLSSWLQFSRYLSPIFVVFVLWITLWLYHWKRAMTEHKFIRLIPIVMIIGLIGVYIFQFRIIETPFSLGYTDLKNSNPDLMAALNAVDPIRPIVTNDYERIYFLTGRPVFSIPGETDELTGQVNPEHEQLMQKIYDLIDRGAVVVIVRAQPTDRFFFDPLLSTLKLQQDFGNIALYTKADSK